MSGGLQAAAGLPRPRRGRRRQILPGFGLTLGYTVSYLGLIVLLPLSAAFIRAAELSPQEWLAVLLTPRVLAAFRVSLAAALAAATISALVGLLVAWVLTRYRFAGRRLLDALVDLPFALPTAVAGISLASLYAPNGWIGRLLAPYGVQIAFQPAGIVVALSFIGLPFVVRTLQPVLGDLDRDLERAAETLGAGRITIFRRVILPALLPALVTGSALAFSRALGEYGSVIFIAGNIPLVSEIVPLVIMTKLEQFQYPAATVIAVAMLLLSFVLMFAVNLLQLWLQRRTGARR
jgi:sulfate transport system permease protein